MSSEETVAVMKIKGYPPFGFIRSGWVVVEDVLVSVGCDRATAKNSCNWACSPYICIVGGKYVCHVKVLKTCVCDLCDCLDIFPKERVVAFFNILYDAWRRKAFVVV